jgi:hypothetical protein
VPKNTPVPIIEKLNSEINVGLADPVLDDELLAEMLRQPLPYVPISLEPSWSASDKAYAPYEVWSGERGSEPDLAPQSVFRM